MFENLTDEEITKVLHYELDNAPTVLFRLDAVLALKLVGLLQLACRHPQIQRDDVEMVQQIADKVKQIGPATAETINLGWDATFDRGADARRERHK